MKLSAKWLTALAAIALLVVAVASLSNNKPASAATGTVFVANEWSKLTNESPAPSGYLNASTVYGTYGSATRLVETNSNRVRIVVVDPDLNTTTQIFNDVVTDIDTNLPSNQTTLNLAAVSPIAGVASSVKVRSGSCVDQTTCDALENLVATNKVSVTIGFAGDGTIAPWITVTSNIDGPATTNVTIEYPSSATNTITSISEATTTSLIGTVKVTSDVSGAAAYVFLNETGLNTGRFVGYVNIAPTTGTDANSGGVGDFLATVRTLNGPLAVSFFDGGPTTVRSAQVLLDLSAPVVTPTAPANKSATQNRFPTFSGSASDSGSGLKLVQQVVSAVNTGPAGTFALFVDEADDAANGTAVLDILGAGLAGDNQAASAGSGVDGQTAFSFSHTIVAAPLPNGTIATPDHFVDWQVTVSDLAGNRGFSDSDTTILTAPTDQGNGTVVTGGFSANRVRIDQKIPAFSATADDQKTGLSLDAAGAPVANRAAIRVRFNDNVANIDASDFTITLDNTATVVPVSVQIKDNAVYITLAANLNSNETPIVALSGSISDLAGNATSIGSVGVTDGNKPVITVTLSGGSGTGTGTESSSQLTKQNMTITVASDETLSAAPTVGIFATGGALQQQPTVFTTGTNTWTATFDGAGPAAGDKSVVVMARDNAMANSPNAAAVNEVIVNGTSTVNPVLDFTLTVSPTAKSFKLDESLTAPATSPAGTTTQRRPFITLDFAGDASTIAISEIKLDGVDVTSQLVSSADKKKFFLVPSADLSLAAHSVTVAVGKATDAAGNGNTLITIAFTVAARSDFSVAIVAGWQAVSFPSDPVVSSIDSVFSNPGIVQVVAYSGGVPSIATKDSVTGKFTSTTVPPLSTIQAGRGYWVQANNFETQKVALVGPVEPGAGSPPPIATIPVVAGWNFIGVTDASREQTQSAHFGIGLMRGVTAVTASDFFAGVNETRVYSYDPTGLRFDEVTGGSPVLIGDGLWVNIAPNADGSVPPIVP